MIGQLHHLSRGGTSHAPLGLTIPENEATADEVIE